MVDAFHDVQFPTGIALGSRGGPSRRTDVVQLSSGQERRIARWAVSRRRYDAGYGLRSAVDLEAVVAFFEARQGRRYAFRWHDPLDHSSAAGGQEPTPTDQPIGVGDGVITQFPLSKTYASGGHTAPRRILTPRAISVVVAFDGVPVQPTEFSVLDDGVIEFATPPNVESVVTAGFLFDVPARFDTDELQLTLEPGGGAIPNIPVVEVLG